MDIIHLRSLLIGISRCLDAYLLHIVNQQGLLQELTCWNLDIFFS